MQSKSKPNSKEKEAALENAL